MKILFVCRANVGRSQMAMSFYNYFTNTTDADSAGTNAENPGETLGGRRKRRGIGTFVIDVMASEGIDVSGNVMTQLTAEMLDNYDTIINIAGEHHTPDWLRRNSRCSSWDIADPGSGNGPAASIMARDKIKMKITELLGGE